MRTRKKENRAMRIILRSAVLLAIVFMFAAYVYQSLQIEFLMTDLHQLNQEKKMLISQTETLQSAVSRLSNVDRISKIAREKFNLVFSNPQPYVIRIEDGASLKEIKTRLAEKGLPSIKIKTASIP